MGCQKKRGGVSKGNSEDFAFQLFFLGAFTGSFFFRQVWGEEREYPFVWFNIVRYHCEILLLSMCCYEEQSGALLLKRPTRWTRLRGSVTFPRLQSSVSRSTDKVASV